MAARSPSYAALTTSWPSMCSPPFAHFPSSDSGAPGELRADPVQNPPGGERLERADLRELPRLLGTLSQARPDQRVAQLPAAPVDPR